MSNIGDGEHRQRDRSNGVLDLIESLGAGDAARNRTDELARGIRTLGLGDAHRIASSSVRIHERAGAGDAVHVVVVGSHETSSLAAAPPTGEVRADAARGAGTASRFGPFLAFVQGVRQAITASPEDLELTAVSIGPGDRLADVTTTEHIGEPDVIVCTTAVCWDPHRPTITTGSRGRIEATLTVQAPAALTDAVYAGASLNPLNRLIECLAALRTDRGRIALPNFYDRAEPPQRGTLAGIEPPNWLDTIGAARTGGSLSPLERVVMWPVLSVLSIESDGTPSTSPSSATARIALSLVPNQRPVDIERSLRAWFTEALPSSLSGSVRITSSARPYVAGLDEPATADLADAVARVHGRAATPVPGGGQIGSGELHFASNTPIVHAGLAGPNERWGTTTEALPHDLVASGTEVARRFALATLRRLRS